MSFLEFTTTIHNQKDNLQTHTSHYYVIAEFPHTEKNTMWLWFCQRRFMVKNRIHGTDASTFFRMNRCLEEVPSTPMKRDVFQRGPYGHRMVSCVVVGCHVLFCFSFGKVWRDIFIRFSFWMFFWGMWYDMTMFIWCNIMWYHIMTCSCK